MLRKIATLKIYFDRSGIYIGYLQFVMTAAILMKSFSIKVTPTSIALLVVAVVITRLVIGWVDMKLIFPHELRKGSEINPWNERIEKKINQIYEITNPPFHDSLITKLRSREENKKG